MVNAPKKREAEIFRRVEKCIGQKNIMIFNGKVSHFSGVSQGRLFNLKIKKAKNRRNLWARIAHLCLLIDVFGRVGCIAESVCPRGL